MNFEEQFPSLAKEVPEYDRDQIWTPLVQAYCVDKAKLKRVLSLFDMEHACECTEWCDCWPKAQEELGL